MKKFDDVSEDELRFAREIYDQLPALGEATTDDAMQLVENFLVKGPETIAPNDRVVIFSAAIGAKLLEIDRTQFHPKNVYGQDISAFLAAALWIGFFAGAGEEDKPEPIWLPD